VSAPFGGRPMTEWTEWELRAYEQLARRANMQPAARAWAEGRLCELAGERWRRAGSPLAGSVTASR
jgi:hypothetical protein